MSSTTATQTTHKAIEMTAVGQSRITDLPAPTPVSGQVLVRVLTNWIAPNAKIFYTGVIPSVSPYPHIPGAGCIGRVVSVGPDAAILAPGQLVFCDPTIRARDDPREKIVHTGAMAFSPAAANLGKAWKDGTMGELAIKPLESVTPINEERLVKDKGYTLEDLFAINGYLLTYEGYRKGRFVPGDCVIVAWASGRLGNGAVELAFAMGAGSVIALGRDATKLAAWKETYPTQYRSRLSTFSPTDDSEADTKALLALTPGGKGADIFFDLSPPQIAFAPNGGSHLASVIAALAIDARVIFMGFIPKPITLAYTDIVRRDLTIVGGFMYRPDVPREVLRMIEAGVLDCRADGKGVYGYPYETKVFEGLESLNEAMEFADTNRLPRMNVFLRQSSEKV